MAEYGITDKGFEIKRLDEILEELHSELSGKFGFNTRLDPQSFLNVQHTADKFLNFGKWHRPVIMQNIRLQLKE